MGKLSTWLVVALTATAFAVGLTGRAIVDGGGGSGKHPTSTSSTPSTTSPGAVRTTPTASRNPAAAPKVPPARRPTASAPSTSTVTKSPTAAPKPRIKRAVLLPETNPAAVGTPTTTGPALVATPPTPIPAAVGTPAPPTGTSSTPGEPGEVEPSARRASIGAALGQLQAAAANTSEAVQGVVQELCLELLNASLPPGGGAGERLPFSCDSK